MFSDIANNCLAKDNYSNGSGGGGAGGGCFPCFCFLVQITTIISESNIFIPTKKD